MRATLLRITLCLPLFLLAQTIQSQDTATNITISNTNASITYTPFLCNADSDPSVQADGKTPSGSVVSTFGPADAGGDIIPQMFFRAHGNLSYFPHHVLALKRHSQCNIFQTPTTVEQTFSPPISIISVVDLNEAKETIFTITYLSGGRLDIGTIMLTVNSQSASDLVSSADSDDH
ncbi:hypothetical protein CPB85DRAFT_1443399 [Mucidula mucida]|nr:hypothetical protein CPB85DRAFT_1443399 [Mucidula mucida]